MGLAKRTVESSVYNIISHGLQTGIGLTRSILLARILDPKLFGIYVFAQAIISLPRALSRFGLGSAYVHRTAETERPEALGVYLSFITLSTLITLVIPGLIVAYFLEGLQKSALLVLIATSCVAHLAVPAQASATRRIAFRRPALIEFVVALVSTVTAVTLALRGFGIWSLLSVDIVAAVIVVVGFYGIRPNWKPHFAWSADIARYYWRYGFKVVQAELLGQLLDRSDDLWAGRFLGDAPLGFYSRAYTFANYPRRVLAQPISTVAIGAYAAAKQNRTQLSRVFFQVNSLIIRMGFLIAGALILTAPELILFVLTEKWLPMVSVFQIFLIFTMIDPIKLTVGKLFTAIGQPEILVRVRVIQLVILFVGLPILGPAFGIEGVAMVSTFMAVIGMMLLLWQAKKFVDYSAIRLFAAPLLAASVGFAAAIILPTYIDMTSAHYLTGALLKLAIFAILYGVMVLIVEYREIRNLITFVSNQFRK